MRVLIDVCHPAHVHFFREPIRLLCQQGHDVLVTSRVKECAVELLGALGVEHECLSDQHRGGAAGMLRELAIRNVRLARVARRYKPDVMTAIGGIFVAQVGRVLGIPSVVFYDTENAKAQNLLTYPFASRVIVPECYAAWTPGGKTVRYSGYHELSYLHPDVFTPDRKQALEAGLAKDRPTYLIRVVAWQANHDIGETGLDATKLAALIDALTTRGKVVISSEQALPDSLKALQYQGPAHALHHLMAHCTAVIGESATIASESASLGVPAIYAAHTSRGYVDDIERRYGLIRKINPSGSVVDFVNEVQDFLSDFELRGAGVSARKNLLRNTISVPEMVVDQLASVSQTGDR